MEQARYSPNIYKVLFFILVIATLFQDLQLQLIFGTIARSPVVFIAPLLFLLLGLIQRKFYAFPFSQLYLKYWFITFTISVITLFLTILFVTKGPPEMYGQSAYGKLFKSSSYSLVFFFFSYALLCSSKKISLDFIYKVIALCFWFLVVAAALEYFDITFLEFLHTQTIYGWFDKDLRIQLTTFEPSVAAPFFVTFAVLFILLRYYLKKGKFLTYVGALLSILILTAIASKGVIVILVSLLWAIRRNITFATVVPVVICALPIVQFIVTDIVPDLIFDIEAFNSVSTRLTTLSASLYSLIVHPLGEGYGTYLYYFPKLVVPVFEWVITTTGIPFLGTELEDMVVTGNSLMPKSGVASEIMYNGWIAVIMLIVLIRYFSGISKKITDKTIYILWSFIMSYIFLSFLFSVSLETSYFFILPLAVVTKIIEEKKDTVQASPEANDVVKKAE